uniref:ComF family protein n=1 Tax=Candidatus Caldatribacterium saccharofermentans TaxID=1454753 RepID=A0A7V4TIG9_9BACT
MDSLLHFFLPQHCVVCGTYVALPSRFPLCERCQSSVAYLREGVCFRCGRTVPHPGILLCHVCRRFRYHFEFARAVSAYTSPVREALHAFKYGGVVSLAGFFGLLLVRYCEEFPFLLDVDGVLPVPLHPSREKTRGFNQSLLLAQEVGRAFRLPVLARSVLRVKPTLPQVGLKAKERRQNVRGAFRVRRKEDILGKRILVIDDVLTSRATAESLAQTLKDAGCRSVMVLAVASGK